MRQHPGAPAETYEGGPTMSAYAPTLSGAIRDQGALEPVMASREMR